MLQGNGFLASETMAIFAIAYTERNALRGFVGVRMGLLFGVRNLRSMVRVNRAKACFRAANQRGFDEWTLMVKYDHKYGIVQ